jgi:molybdopterin-guanine dinucleotide biosynthesis protein A
MGEDKALVQLHGLSLIERTLSAVSTVCSEIVIIANNAEPLAFLHLPVLADVYPDCGPIGGIHAALASSRTDRVFIIACDLPLVTPALIQHIADQNSMYDLIVPSCEGKLQPLCAVYHRRALPAIERTLIGGMRRVTDLQSILSTLIVPLSVGHPCFHPGLFTNVNTRESLEHIAATMAPVWAGKC